MSFPLHVLLGLLYLFGETGGSNSIIFLNMFNSKSHALTMLPLAERLADDGHNVSMYSIVAHSFRITSEKVKMLESVATLGESTEDAPDSNGVSRIFWNYDMMPWFGSWCYEMATHYLEQGRDSQLEIILNTPYDLAVVDETYSALQGSIALKLREKFGTKMIAFATTELMPVAANMRGYARNPVTVPNTFLLSSEIYNGDGDGLTMRIRKVFEYLIDQVYSGPLASQYSVISGQMLGLHDATKAKTFSNSLLTVNDFPDTFSFISPRGNDLIPVGEHCTTGKILPREFRDFVEDPFSKGTIYVAFGSYINLEDGPAGTIDEFVKALNHFDDHRIIWSHKGNVNGTKCHVKVVKWAPQKELLSHEKTLVFFTHGGLKSAKEGVCSAVPMLFLPFFGDQPRNAHRFVKHGIAEALYKNSLRAEDIVLKLTRLLENPNYKTNVEKIKSLYLDGPVNALDLGAFQISKILRRKETDFVRFQKKSIFMNHLQYLNFDILIPILVLLYMVAKV